jgi:hypothetical protein
MKILTPFAILLSASCLWAQGAYVTADPTNRYSPGSVLGNPSLAAGSEQFVVGMKTHQMGATGSALGLRSLFFSYSSPGFLPSGFMLGAEMFSTGNYQRNRVQAGYSWRPLRDLDLGMSLGMHHIRYSDFSGDDFQSGDPLLSSPSKIAPVVGLGLRYRWNSVVLGLGLEDLNRPDIAIGSDPVRLPVRYNMGVGVELGNFTPYLTLSNRNTWLAEPGFFGKDMTVGIGLNFYLGGQGFVSGGFQDRSASMGGGVMVTDNLQTTLRYEPAPSELSDFSYGSTTLALIWDVMRHRDLDVPGLIRPRLPGLLPTGQMGLDVVQDKREFFILSPITDLTIVQSEIERDINFPVLRRLNVTSLPIWSLVPQDIQGAMVRTRRVLPDSVASMEILLRQPGIELPDQWGFSSRYYAEMQLSRVQQDQNNTQVNVVVLSGEALDQSLVLRDLMESPRAELGMEYLVDKRGRVDLDDLESIVELMRREKRYLLNHRNYRLWIVPIHMEGYTGNWAVNMVDATGTTVKTWQGQGLPPDHVEWDWRMADGSYLLPGEYTIQMDYSDGGQWHKTRPQYLFVDLRKRTKSLRIDDTEPVYRRNIESKTFFLGLQGDLGENRNPTNTEEK